MTILRPATCGLLGLLMLLAGAEDLAAVSPGPDCPAVAHPAVASGVQRRVLLPRLATRRSVRQQPAVIFIPAPVAPASPAPPAPAVAPEVPDVAAVDSMRVVALGYSVRGVPITMHVFGRGPDVTFIFGAIHGNEGNSGELCRLLIDHLERHPEVWSGTCVAVLPVANPDGLVQNRRTNVNGVDLNRNLPASNWKVTAKGATWGGERPASEPETQALLRAIDGLQPSRIVSVHAITGGRECNNYDGPAADLAAVMASKNGYRVAPTIGYPTPGSFGSYAGHDLQIPTITLELPAGADGGECWQRHREALLAVIQWVSER